MNRLLQTDVHPDAESLNAFVERALPQPERAQIVAHLGACARCREVVFLAQAAAQVDAAPLAAVKTESHGVKSARPWWRAGFTNWRIALIPAAALATAVGLLIWVQMKPRPSALTVAQVSLPPPSAMPSSAAPPVPRPVQAATASAAPPVAVQQQPKAARADRRNSTLSMNGPAGSEKTPNPPSPVAEPKAPDGFDADRNVASMERQAAAREAMIAPTVPPASPNAEWNGNFEAKAKAAKQAQMTSIQAPAAPPAPAPVPPDFVAVHGSLMAPATAGRRPLAAEAAASRQIELMPHPVNGPFTLGLTSHPRLPSGLNAVSSAVMLDRILAVDPDGAVFLSRDATKHWERVPIQWTGKAVSVQAPVAPPPTGQSLATPPAAPGPPPLPANLKAAQAGPGMLFTLINDHHQAWVSPDGSVWHELPGRE